MSMIWITNKHNFSPAYTRAQKKLSDAEFDYNEKKNMILGGVKKINLEICTSVQNW